MSFATISIYPVTGYDLTPEEFNHWKNQYLNKMGNKYIAAEKYRIKKFSQLITRQDIKGIIDFINEQPKIFYQYLDKAISNEESFYKHLNYIHHNPVKHGYVNKMENWPFSSYNDYIKKYGLSWLDECFEKYPIIDFTPIIIE